MDGYWLEVTYQNKSDIEMQMSRMNSVSNVEKLILELNNLDWKIIPSPLNETIIRLTAKEYQTSEILKKIAEFIKEFNYDSSVNGNSLIIKLKAYEHKALIDALRKFKQ